MKRKSIFLLMPLMATPLTLTQTSCFAQNTSTVSSGPMEEVGAPFGKLRLVDEINCGVAPGSHEFTEVPVGSSKVETILGKQCRVLPNAGPPKSFAYRIGKNKGLKAGAAYVLSVEFPEDKSRSLFIVNRGAEMVRGVRTGAALGDVLYNFVNNNSESIKIPLSGEFRDWKAMFHLHDRTFKVGLASDQAGKEGVPRSEKPEDGFWVAITQSKGDNDPISAGAAVSRIRLYEVSNPEQLKMPVNFPPAGLPRRHLFWREEMADGVVSPDKPEERGVTNRVEWYEYKARLMEFLGMNTFSKDLLEFGHNQGWDSGPTNDWYNGTNFNGLWGEILDVMDKHNFDVLPYYEYTGSVGAKGLGGEKRAKTLNGNKDYTHIWWTESWNVDITDPDTLADAKRLLDATIVRYKDKTKFVGAWFRPRPSQIPIGFGDATLARFAAEANQGQAVTRDQLKADKALLDRYYAWWYGKRRDFLVALSDYLRANGIPAAEVMFTPDAAEPGRNLVGPHTIVTDDIETWKPLLQSEAHKNMKLTSLDQVIREDGQFKALTTPRTTWAEWEWQHSDPPADPQNYKNTPGALLTYSYNRLYTVANPKAFDAFRAPAGLAAIMHYTLNEISMEPSLGYIASDVEYAGPYSMLSEARALANGDPRYLGYLSASSFNRGFPEYARAFNAAFLSLPALPSTVLTYASTDSDVVVREIKTPQNGTYYAVINVGLQDKKGTKVTLPAKGKLFDATTGNAITAKDNALQLTMYPAQVRTFVVR